MLNYDTMIERSLRGYNDGFQRAYLDDQGHEDEYSTFDSEKALEFRDLNIVCHPHGCVNYAGHIVNKPHGDAELCLWDDCKAISSNKVQYLGPESYDDNLSPIVTGQCKNRNFCNEPFKTYMTIINSRMRDNDSILIIGYGFGDEHINSVIENYGKGSGKHILMITKYDKNTPKNFKSTCGYDITQSDGVWKSEDRNAVCFLDGFKAACEGEFLENITDILKSA